MEYKIGMDPDANPFAVLSLIVAPSILTNASSVLIMSTSNRLARAVDRARELSKQLEAMDALDTPEAQRRIRELSAAETRALLLLRSLRIFYIALGGFAAAALISLLGAVIAPVELDLLGIPLNILMICGVAAGLVAVGSLSYGSALLFRETRIAVQVLSERAKSVRARLPDGV